MATAERVRLVVAAERREFRGILRSCGLVRDLKWPVAFAVSAEMRGVPYVFAANGPGPRLVRKVLDAAGKSISDLIGSVISTGFCGGLDPRLELGTIVEASRVVDLDMGMEYASRPVGTSTERIQGTVLSMDRVAGTVEEKANLRKQNGDALAIEMEAGAVAAWAQQHSLPFYCVRVVSDGAGDGFPFDMNRMRDAAGRFDLWKIAGKALLSPARRIPGLLKIDRDCLVAEEKLGAFFANCRFE